MDSFYLALLLYLAAIVLAAVDLFVPSGGMLVALASLAAFGSVLFGFRSGTHLGMAMLAIVAASVPAFAFAAIKIWPHTPFGRRIILALPRHEEEKKSNDDPLRELVGRVMIADTALLPTGQLRLGHRRFNAVAENSFIEAGERIKVVAVRERNLVVRITSEPLTIDPKPDGGQGENNSQAKKQSLLDVPAEELGLDSIDE